MKQNKAYINIAEAVGGGYNAFWNFKGRYRVVKGSRGSKKSKTTALWFIYNLMKYRGSNLLVVRKTLRTMKDSCFTELKWAIDRLQVGYLWKVIENPLEMTYIPTGQKIYFRGFDDALKITSITVRTGALCWAWIEEAYEITEEADFDMLDEGIRGITPPPLFKQLTITFNPWNEHHWLKKRFFDVKDPEILAITTTYMCNEWLDEADRRKFEDMKIRNPKRYRVAGLGEWGISDGVIYDNWKEISFDVNEVSRRDGVTSVFGLDFGYTNDPTALFCGLADAQKKELYVFDELYEKALTNFAIADKIRKMGYGKEKIIADCAEPKSIDELRLLGVRRVSRARKGRDSINNGIQFLQGYKIFVHPRCANFITEISNYQWAKDKDGHTLNKPIDDFNHLMDAMRYGMEKFNSGCTYSFD